MQPPLDLNTKLNNMIEEIPIDTNDGAPRREHNFSRADARYFANMMMLITEAGGCNRGMSEEQGIILRDIGIAQLSALKEMQADEIKAMGAMVKERKRILALIGLMTLSFLGWVGEQLLASMNWKPVKDWLIKAFGGHS